MDHRGSWVQNRGLFEKTARLAVLPCFPTSDYNKLDLQARWWICADRPIRCLALCLGVSCFPQEGFSPARGLYLQRQKTLVTWGSKTREDSGFSSGWGVKKSNDFIWLAEATKHAFILAFPQRKPLIAQCKNTQVSYVGWNLKSQKSTLNVSTTLYRKKYRQQRKTVLLLERCQRATRR